MLEILTAADNIVTVALRGTIRTTDLDHVREHLDGLVARYGTLRLLLDVSEFGGWHDLQAAKAHFAFIKDHHQRVERIAVLASSTWQQWLAAALGAFLHPEIRVFEPDQSKAALAWLVEME